MWRLWEKAHKENSLDTWERIEAIQNMTNEVFPRGGEDNQRHIGSTKQAATIVTGIDMGKPRFPYMFPEEDFSKKLKETLPKLRKLIKST